MAACRYYDIPRSEYYYWHKRWEESGKQLTSLYNLPTTPSSHKNDVGAETVSLIVQLRLAFGYGEDALAHVLRRDYDVAVSHHGVGNVLKRAGLLTSRKRRVRKSRQLSDRQYSPGEVSRSDGR